MLLLSKGFSLLNNSVIICNSVKEDMMSSENVVICNNLFFNSVADKADVILCSRTFPRDLDRYINIKPIFYYAQDAYDQVMINNWMWNYRLIDALSGIFCLSEWQKRTFIKYFNIPNELHSKFHVVGNPVDVSLSYGVVKKNKNRLMFAGIPYKGLDILKKVFDAVCIESKRDDLELYIYSSMELYNQTDREYDKVFSDLSNTNNVFLNKPCNIKDLMYNLGSSKIYLSPSTYHETFGILLVQAQLMGCIPVCMNNGSSTEVVDNGVTGMISKYPNIYNKDGFNDFVSNILYLLNNDTYKMEIKAREFAKKWDYIVVANKVLSIFNNS
jgi:glycosyltransferase involved in cell wall biosynthesis